MFYKKSKSPDFTDKLQAAKYDCIHRALTDILKMDDKTIENGKEVTNYARLCSAQKTRARLALDFVANLEKSDDDK